MLENIMKISHCISKFSALVLMWTFRSFHKKTTITDVEKE